jgi:hypothetical protein
VQFEKASGFSLNAKKCVLVPLWDITPARLQQWLATNAPHVKGCTISRHAKYLGIMLGPAAAELSWIAPAEKLIERARQVRSMKQGFFKAILNYRIYALPVLAHVGQFENAPAPTLKNEAKALQIITTGPWNAIPKDLLYQLTKVGFPIEAPSVALLNRAQMYRTAISSNTFAMLEAKLEQTKMDDDAVLCPSLRYWHNESHFMQILGNRREIEKIPGAPNMREPEQVQSQTLKLLQGRREECPPLQIFMRRLTYWELDGITAERICLLLNRLQMIGRRLPPFIFSAVLRTLLNGWCTSRRFQEEVLPCRLCGTKKGDDIKHYTMCDAVLHFTATELPRMKMPWSSPSDPLAGFLLLGSKCDALQTCGIAILHDIVLSAVNDLRARGAFADKIESITLLARRNALHGTLEHRAPTNTAYAERCLIALLLRGGGLAVNDCSVQVMLLGHTLGHSLTNVV